MDEQPPIHIERHESDHRGAFYVPGADGKRVAEMTYVRHDPQHVTIDHTAVDDSLRGHGVARKLLDAAVAWARESGTRFTVTCSYARSQFDKDMSLRDVLL
jgi:predicted GNAT family acetyltransferase